MDIIPYTWENLVRDITTQYDDIWDRDYYRKRKLLPPPPKKKKHYYIMKECCYFTKYYCQALRTQDEAHSTPLLSPLI